MTELKAFLILSAALFTLFSIAARAEQNPCAADTVNFCGGHLEPGAQIQCLIKHVAQVAPECRAELERVLQARDEAAYRGGGALTSFGGLNALGAPIPLFSYEGRLTPKQNGPSFFENKANLSLPVYHSGQDSLGLSLAGEDMHLSDTLHLDTGAPVPTDLSRLEAGVQYYHRLESGNWSVRGSLGYASDRAFHDLSFGLSATYGFPAANPNGYWILMAFWGNNNALVNYVPIPGFAYVYKTPTLTGVFGLPVVMVQWTPRGLWVYSFSAFGPTIQAEVANGRLNHFQVFARYAFTLQTYIPSERPEDRDRLILRAQKIDVGFRTPLAHQLLSELAAGVAYDRSIYIGKSVFKSDQGSVRLGPDWSILWSLKYAF